MHAQGLGAKVLRIGVVDDHHSIVRGLASIADEHEDMTVVAGAETVAELLTQADDLDLVILDLRLADGSSPRANVERLRDAGLNTLVYTSGDEPYLVRQAAAAGVLGVLRKSARPSEIAEAIRCAAAGEQFATMDWAAAIDSDEDFVDLPPRLRQVLELYAAGEPTSRVAAQTDLSTETVNAYVGRIRAKYSAVGRPAPTKTDLYKRAIEDGWLPIPRRFRR
jgi:DNA-binding NarL/FixJ family response regulator